MINIKYINRYHSKKIDSTNLTIFHYFCILHGSYHLLEIATQKLTAAELQAAKKADMRGITDGWEFSWKKHFELPNSKAFKIVLTSNPNEIQGLLIFQMLGKEEPYMAFLESAPHNKGKDKQFD